MKYPRLYLPSHYVHPPHVNTAVTLRQSPRAEVTVFSMLPFLPLQQLQVSGPPHSLQPLNTLA
jgi:hypothetical protein